MNIQNQSEYCYTRSMAQHNCGENVSSALSQHTTVNVEFHQERMQCFPCAPWTLKLITAVLVNVSNPIRSADVHFRSVPAVCSRLCAVLSLTDGAQSRSRKDVTSTLVVVHATTNKAFLDTPGHFIRYNSMWSNATTPWSLCWHWQRCINSTNMYIIEVVVYSGVKLDEALCWEVSLSCM